MTHTLGTLDWDWQQRGAGFPLTVIQVEERARYLGALDQEHAGQLLDRQTFGRGRGRAQPGFGGGWEMIRYLDALDGGHAGNLLPLQTLVALAIERSLELGEGKSGSKHGGLSLLG